tara:strand:+ start:124 stop:693 length:570 start_codon:yes stop_codon:yes gene_type:complete
MKHDAKQTSADVKAKQPNLTKLQNPLDFIAEDHMLEREVCAIIDTIVSNASTGKMDCERVVSFLTERLPQHLADEEIDLFPMMLERCVPEDEIQRVIDKLQSDHGHALADTPAVVALIDSKDGSSGGLSKEACAQLTEFAVHARRHLILENAIILPIARARLTKHDLDIMRQHMLERRSLDLPPEGLEC